MPSPRTIRTPATNRENFTMRILCIGMFAAAALALPNTSPPVNLGPSQRDIETQHRRDSSVHPATLERLRRRVPSVAQKPLLLQKRGTFSELQQQQALQRHANWHGKQWGKNDVSFGYRDYDKNDLINKVSPRISNGEFKTVAHMKQAVDQLAKEKDHARAMAERWTKKQTALQQGKAKYPAFHASQQKMVPVA